jgi:hypothetical protein
MAENYWGGQEEHRNKGNYRGNSRKENLRIGLLKDLYGSDRARLEMESHQRPDSHISDTLKRIMDNAKIDDRAQFSDLLAKWEELVGVAVSTLCRPTAINGSTLMIEVDHSSAMHVLETYNKKDIQKRVTALCKDVRYIKFVPSGSKI